jgi:hypothetical protein
MSTAASSPPWRGRANPFPAAAVARVSDLQLDVPTIRTPAVREVRALAEAYLKATRAADHAPKTDAPKTGTGPQLADAGSVIVIAGEYGTGKTHLAMEIQAHIERSRAAGRPETRIIYHVVPGGTFLTLYTDLMAKRIGRQEVRERVVEFYADVVAGALRDRPFTGDLVRQLELGEAGPQAVVERLGLMEGGLLQELRRRMSAVTGEESFGSALVFLLHPALEDAAWRWLCGEAPDPVLVERGISKQIETDRMALEALGVLALLYGRKNRRFVLIVDEMEKVILTWERSPEESIQAFKQLLEVFRSAGAMLVSCGLPDIFDILPRDPGRIDSVIVPSGLTEADVCWYIEETQERAFQVRELAPFDQESVRYLVSLTGGVAREIVKLCYHAYERAAATGREVTPALVREAARARFAGDNADMVRGEVDMLLRDEGWEVHRDQVLAGSADSRVDFWIPAGEKDSGGGIIISDVILQEQEAAALEKRARAIQSSAPHREVLLVVSGYLSAELEPRLAAAYGRPPIVHAVRRFDGDFGGSLKAAISRMAPTLRATPSRAPDEGLRASGDVRELREQTVRIGRQQSQTQRLVRELAERVNAVSAASDERLEGIRRALEAVPGVPGPDSAATAAPDHPLPDVLERLFDQARRSLAAFGDVKKLLGDIFESSARMPGATARLTYRMRASEAFTPIGVAGFLGSVLASFHDCVRQWLESLRSGGRVAAPNAVDRDRLREICRTYEALYGVTPLFQLDPLAELTGPGGEQQGELERSTRTSRRASLRDAFDGLSDRVYQAAVDVADGAADSPSQVAN